MKTITNISTVIDRSGEPPVVVPSNPVMTVVKRPPPSCEPVFIRYFYDLSNYSFCDCDCHCDCGCDDCGCDDCGCNSDCDCFFDNGFDFLNFFLSRWGCDC